MQGCGARCRGATIIVVETILDNLERLDAPVGVFECADLPAIPKTDVPPLRCACFEKGPGKGEMVNWRPAMNGPSVRRGWGLQIQALFPPSILGYQEVPACSGVPA